MGKLQARAEKELMRHAPTLSFLKVLDPTQRTHYLRPLTPHTTSE